MDRATSPSNTDGNDGKHNTLRTRVLCTLSLKIRKKGGRHCYLWGQKARDTFFCLSQVLWLWVLFPRLPGKRERKQETDDEYHKPKCPKSISGYYYFIPGLWVYNLQQIHNIKEHTGEVTQRRRTEDNLKSLPIAVLGAQACSSEHGEWKKESRTDIKINHNGWGKKIIRTPWCSQFRLILCEEAVRRLIHEHK